MNAPHISERVAWHLESDGWEVHLSDGSMRAIRIAETGGAFGATCQTLQIDSGGRWLERVDGWGTVERDVDLRNYTNPADAVRDALA